MLTERESRQAITGGAVSIAGIVLFVGLAVAVLLVTGVDTADAALFPSLYVMRILRFTLLQASLSTVLSIVVAIPVARALARQPRFYGRVWLIRLMAIPMGLPVLVGALGLLGIWGRHGIANGILAQLGATQPVSIYGLGGILLAHVFFNMPLATRLMLAELERIPEEYWLMAGGLGMRSASIFRFIEWPVLRPLIPGIAGLVFMLCATSFTLVLTLGGGPSATTIEVAIYQAMRFDFDPTRAVVLSLMQVALTGLVLAAMAFFPPPVDQGATTGTRLRRIDGNSFTARLSDGIWLLSTVIFIGFPLGSVAISGLKSAPLRLVTQAIFLKATATSLAIALAAALIAVCMSLAIIRARSVIIEQRRTGRGLHAFAAALGATGSLVLLVPPVVLATGWFLALRPLADPTSFATVLIILINGLMALPFVIRVLEPAYAVHRRRTARLSASLGLTSLSRLRIVDWPGLRKPILTALSFAMALSLGDLGAVALFGSDSLVTLPWLVYSRLGSYRTAEADGFALILGLICLLLTIPATTGRTASENESRTDD